VSALKGGSAGTGRLLLDSADQGHYDVFTVFTWLGLEAFGSHYIHRSLDRPELLAYYRAAHIALVTPLKDGMNLAAKEYCAARVHDDGVLILSEFAGSAFQLNRGALLVNPYDTRAVAEAIEIACDMPPAEQKKRIRKLKARIRQEDIFHWRDSFWACGDIDARTPRLAEARAADQKSVDV
jgi:trehalose-6-phosphate synthase